MAAPERFEALILGSGAGGKLLAWHLARSGRRTAVVERQWVGGSCPNVNCMPSKNEIWSANVAYVARHAAEFGTTTGRRAGASDDGGGTWPALVEGATTGISIRVRKSATSRGGPDAILRKEAPRVTRAPETIA